MWITEALSRLVAVMALLVAVLMLAPTSALAHAGHAHAASPISQIGTHSGHEVAPAETRVMLLVAPASDDPAGPCTTNCCAAGMRCCAALGTVAGEMGSPQPRSTRRVPLVIKRAGIEPAVPLKPPRATDVAHTRAA